jgi:hypothetical protein
LDRAPVAGLGRHSLNILKDRADWVVSVGQRLRRDGVRRPPETAMWLVSHRVLLASRTLIALANTLFQPLIDFAFDKCNAGAEPHRLRKAAFAAKAPHRDLS